MYIDRMCSISPAGLFTGGEPLPEAVPVRGGRMLCTEPDYKDIIPPMQLRRMSKPVRTGVAAARICLGNVNGLLAVNVGTAYGMLQDSESFLDKMVAQEEQLLNPTAFIQSTHNTVGGQIALSLSCHAHNMTYVHKGHSFESALLDTELMLSEKADGKVLVGAVDECTATSFDILSELGIYNEHVPSGEGAHFYLMTGRPGPDSLAEIPAFDMFIARNATLAADRISQFMQARDLQPARGDLLLWGASAAGASREDYDYIGSRIFSGMAAVAFKQYSGEYPTASGFALALAVAGLRTAPAAWIVNNYGPYWSLFYLKKAS